MSQSERIRSPPARRYIPDLVSASTRTSPTRAYDRQEAYVQLAAMGEEPTSPHRAYLYIFPYIFQVQHLEAAGVLSHY